MIILDYLNPIFGDYLIEISLGKHVTRLLYGIHPFCLRVDPRSLILAIVEVDTYLPLIVELIGIYIGHLHLLGINGLIGEPVVLLEVLGQTEHFAPARVSLLPNSLQRNVHVDVRVVVGGSETYCVFSVGKKAEGSFFILTMSLCILTVINLGILNSTSNTHATKRHLFRINFRDSNWHRCNLISIIL